MKVHSFLVLSLFISILCTSCGNLFNAEDDSGVLARVGDNYLYVDDIRDQLPDLSTEDSVAYVNNYIRSWATKQLLLSRSKINLPEEKITEFEALVSDYRTELYTRAYKEALVLQSEDTLVTSGELERFYEEEKENFKLKEKLVKIRFVELPKQFLNKDEVIQRLRRFEEDDLKFLDSVGVQFRKLNFNDSIWVPVSRVIEEVPPITFDNEGQYLKKSQFTELEDQAGVYLINVNEILEINDIAPLSYIQPTIRQVLLNRRKLSFIRKLETELLDEAVQQRELEIYDNNE